MLNVIYARRSRLLALLVVLILAACNSEPQPTNKENLAATTFTIGGSVKGLTGELRLLLNSNETLILKGNGRYQFSETRLKSNDSYSITIEQQPNGQICELENSSGFVLNADITSANINCDIEPFVIKGQLSGLDQYPGRVLLEFSSVGGEDQHWLSLEKDGDFEFDRLPNGTTFTLAVTAYKDDAVPGGLACESNKVEVTLTDSDITDIEVNCRPAPVFLVEGDVSDLIGGSLAMRLTYGANDKTEDLTVTKAGSFKFNTLLAHDDEYKVSIIGKPDSMSCSVENSEGDINDDGVRIDVDCSSESAELQLELNGIKSFRFSWKPITWASRYKLLEDVDGNEFDDEDVQVYTVSGSGTNSIDILVPLYARAQASYKLQTCGVYSGNEFCVDDKVLFIEGSSQLNSLVDAIGYFKASDADADDQFGYTVSLSEDGTVMAVGAPAANKEDGSSAGAVYLFKKTALGDWSQQATLEAPNGDADDRFGAALSLSGNGKYLAVGAPNEDGSGAGVVNVNLDDSDTFPENEDISIDNSGAVYVFNYDGQDWQVHAYVKACNSGNGENDNFGTSVSLDRDGMILAVGAHLEDSDLIGTEAHKCESDIDKPESNPTGYWVSENRGAVYVYERVSEESSDWDESVVFLKPIVIPDDPNSDEQGGIIGESGTHLAFGSALSLSGDGSTLVVGAPIKLDLQGRFGRVYSFTRQGPHDWKPSNEVILPKGTKQINGRFGLSVSLNTSGTVLAVGVPYGSEDQKGRVYTFRRTGNGPDNTWIPNGLIRADDYAADPYDNFGRSVSLNNAGDRLAIGASEFRVDRPRGEAGSAFGVHSDISSAHNNNFSDFRSGAVYTYQYLPDEWQFESYVKAPNNTENRRFGVAVDFDGNGDSLAVGDIYESSDFKGIDRGAPSAAMNEGAPQSGAVFLY